MPMPRHSPNGRARSCPRRPSGSAPARGGLDGATYPWGDDPTPNGKQMANTWQGEFPWQNSLLDGLRGNVTGEALPANGFGLYDVVGNVWEWTVGLVHAATHE